MTTEFTAMPDFADLLERDLRAEAARLAVAPPRRALPRRRATLAGGLAIGAAAAAIIATSLGSTPPPAYAGPLIVTAPAAEAPDVVRRLESGVMVQFELGPDVRFDQVRKVDTAAGPAYVAGGTAGWCITVPDAASPNPAVERGVACATPAEFQRIGLSVSVGGQFVAALPQDVRQPTVRRNGQRPESLHPSKYGVVSLPVKRGDTVTLFDTTGKARADRMN